MSTTEPRLPDETARPEPSARAAEKKEEEDGVAGGEGRRRRMRRPRVAINSIELLDIDDDDDGGGPDSCAPGQGGCRGRAKGDLCSGASRTWFELFRRYFTDTLSLSRGGQG